MDWTRKAVFPLLLLLAAVIGPRPAGAADATLYEVFENMSLVQRDGSDFREGWAALAGTARPGTLLCPLLVTCALHATGASSVDILTGLGTFSGDLKVVVQGDNQADGPEAIVLTGKFGGSMDFSPAVLYGLPYGIVVGEVTVYGRGSSPFTGIFALPFRKGTPILHYLTFTNLQPTGTVMVRDDERLFGEPMVKFEICLGSGC